MKKRILAALTAVILVVGLLGIITASAEEIQETTDNTEPTEQTSVTTATSTTPPSTSVTTVTDVPVSTTVTTAQTTTAKKTTVKKPAKVTKVKITVMKTKIKVTWKKIKNVSGYQVKASTNKKYTKNKKTVTVKKNKATLDKLKTNKNYYIKVRAYKKVSGKKYYGKWSKSKKYNISDNPTDAEKMGCALLDKTGRSLYAVFKYSKMTWTKASTNAKLGTEYFANYGFTHKTGNCYVMAGKFTVLARLLGYDAVQASGCVLSSYGKWIPHSWVLIKMNGKTYVFDPDFEYETGRSGYKFQYYWKEGGYIVGDGKHWKYKLTKKMR